MYSIYFVAEHNAQSPRGRNGLTTTRQKSLDISFPSSAVNVDGFAFSSFFLSFLFSEPLAYVHILGLLLGIWGSMSTKKHNSEKAVPAPMYIVRLYRPEKMQGRYRKNEQLDLLSWAMTTADIVHEPVQQLVYFGMAASAVARL